MENNKSLVIDKSALLRSNAGEKTINIPELGGAIKIKGLSFSKRNSITKGATNINKEMDYSLFQILVIIECMVEPKLTHEDEEMLKNCPFSIIDKISKEIFTLSGMSFDVKEKEDAKKKLEPIQVI